MDSTSASAPAPAVILSAEKPYFAGRPGPGRPKGIQNSITRQQREVAEMVLGKRDSPEFAEFVRTQRTHLLAGVMPPAIVALWLHYLLGKPAERIEVKDTTNELDGINAEQLRARAQQLAQRIVEPPSVNVIEGEVAH